MKRILHALSTRQLAPLIGVSLLVVVSALGGRFLYQKWLKPISATPKPVYLSYEQEKTAHAREKISAASGGQLSVNTMTLDLPAGFTDQDVVVAYSLIKTPNLQANAQVGPMFQFTAKTEDKTSVTQFTQPLTLTIPINEGAFEEYGNDVSLYFFDTETKKWEAVPSQVDPEKKQLVATLEHFTTFVMAGEDPNLGVTQVEANPFLVDDGQGEPYFIEDGQTDDDQELFWGSVGSGYAEDARYTGNSVNTTPHNWATWNVYEGLTGEQEIEVTIPDLKGKPLTHGATYVITHANGTTSVTIDQEANRGGIVSLGTYTFNGSGSVYLNDVVPEQGGFFLSHIVFDAVSFGVGFDANLDIVGPEISDVRAVTDNGTFRLNIKVTDVGSGVDPNRVYFVFEGAAYPMTSMGDDRYAIDFPYSRNANLDYYIVAYDLAGNETPWHPSLGYITRGAFYRLTGYYPGMLKDPNSNCNTKYGCPNQNRNSSQIVGHPINTANGNLIEEVQLVSIGGRPEINLGLTYNNQSGRASIFGENWTHSYNYHAIEVETPTTASVFIQYPDGKVVSFSGPDLEPEPGYFEKLERSGDGFILTFPDLTQITFNGDGDIVRWEDANDNGLTFAYGETSPHTLMSELLSVTADGGRAIQLTYNADGLVESLTAPESKTLHFTYTSDYDLASWTDGRGGVTSYTYNDHNMLTAVTPEGFTLMTNQFDGERRVVDHQVGEAFHQTFSYADDQTVVTDAHGYDTNYRLNDDKLVTRITNEAGYYRNYTFTDEKQVEAMTDEEGHTWEYEYDDRGNQTVERDPLGFEIVRTFDSTFNKPLSEINKIADHVTTWTYDSRGNLLTETHAEGGTRTLTYNGFGQLVSETDFRNNLTTYGYNDFGDQNLKTDAISQSTNYAYDGLGRLISVTNPRTFTYTYTYDLNDNLLAVDGPLGYHLGYVYDKNNRLTEEIDANGGSTKYVYDKSDNLTEQRNQLEFATTYTYGPMNELLTSISPEGHVTHYAYDTIYNLVTLTEAVGTSDERLTSYDYNKRQEVVAVTDAEGRVTKLTYDPLGRLTKEVRNAVFGLATASQNVTTSYEYNATGALTKVIDPNNNSTSHELDKLDRVIQTTDAENQITKFAYDTQGNLITLTNPRTFSTTYEFDPLNRLATVIDAKNGATTYTYDPNSNLASVTDANAITSAYTYDALDRRDQKVANSADGGASAITNVTTKYAYDPHGNLTAVTNPRGYQTTFVYDPAHRNTQIIDALTHATVFTYDKEDNLTQLTDRNNHSRQYRYDALNRLVTFINPETHQEEYRYDKVDNQVQFTNLRGKVYAHEYDPLDRLIKTTNPLAGVKEYSYDAVGNLLTLKDENTHVDTFTYDKVYRLTKSTDAENNPTTFAYDANGNRIKVTDAENNATAFVYDELDRLIEQTNAENETEKYEYDKTVNLTKKIEADNTPHSYTYDPLYRLAMVINNARGGEQTQDTNVTTRYQYDPNGNLTATIDALSQQTQFTYDPLDRLASETNPLTNTWQYGYDREANLISRLDANGAETKYGYYPDDVLALIDYPEYDVSYTYSPTNFPEKMVDNLGTTTWKYDVLDRVEEQLDPLNRKVSYTYDAVGNLTQLTYPDGRTMAHSYLKNDWLNKSENSDRYKIEYTRNKVGLPTLVDRSNSSKSQITYDKVYRQLEVHDKQLPKYGNHLISKYNYTYNDVGHITQEVSEYGWRQPAKVTTNFNYDGLHRLTQAESDDKQKTNYAYDAVGNRTTLTEQLTQGPETRQYSYNSGNQLKEVKIDSPLYPNVVTNLFEYDANGNRVDKLIKDGTGVEKGTTYDYDTENRLIQAQDYQRQLYQDNQLTATDSAQVATDSAEVASESATVAVSTESAKPVINLARTDTQYDGYGRRLTSTYYSGDPTDSDPKRTEYTYDRLDPVAETYQWSGQRKNLYRTTMAPVTNQMQPSDPLHSQFRPNVGARQGTDLAFYQDFKSETTKKGTLYWYHYDGQDNIAGTTKHQAESDHTYRYDEFGTILPEEGAAGWKPPHNDYTLEQKQYDANEDLFYYGSRFYDAQTGTWMNQDSYRGQLNDPRTLHRYQYNLNGPVNYVDMYGYCAESDPNCNSGMISVVGGFIGGAIDYAKSYVKGYVYQTVNNSTFNVPYNVDQTISRMIGHDEAYVDRVTNPGFQEGRQNANTHSLIQGGAEIVSGGAGVTLGGGTLAACPASFGFSCPITAPVGISVTTVGAVTAIHGASVVTCASLNADKIKENVQRNKAGKVTNSIPPKPPRTGNTTVYHSLTDDSAQYVGITDDIQTRSAAHLKQKGISIEPIPGLESIAREDARAVEQVLIEYYGLGKNGGSLMNKINSIAQTNPTYAQSLTRGVEILKYVDYPGF